MKVLFAYNYGKVPQYPVGIGILSAMLKRFGHETQMITIASEEPDMKLVTAEKAMKPDVVAFSSMSSMYERVKLLSKKTREILPDTFQICGGIHTTLVPESIEETDLDAVCIGEGEYAIVNLLDNIENKRRYTHTDGFWFKTHENKIIKNGPAPLVQNLDALPMPDYDMYYSQDIQGKMQHRAEFLFCRGCPFDCTYCSNHAIKALHHGQKYIRYPSVERAIEEVKYVTKKYNMTFVAFNDDIITLNKSWFYDFFQRYKRDIAIPFYCNIRPKTCDAEMFKLLKGANCDSVAIGLESGNSFIRKKILNRNIADEDILATFKMAHDHGIKTHSFAMVGIPYETKQTIIDTAVFSAKLGEHNDPWRFIFHPYPKTELYKLCIEKGWIGATLDDYSEERSVSVLRLPTIAAHDINAYHKIFHIIVKVEQFLSLNASGPVKKIIRYLYRYPRYPIIILLFHYYQRLKILGLKKSISIMIARCWKAHNA